MSTNLEKSPPADATAPSNAPAADKPSNKEKSPPPAKPIDAPDALRPGSANDPRNRNKIDPTHLSAGTDKQST